MENEGLFGVVCIYSVKNILKDETGMTRILIASDIHGSREYCERLINIFGKEEAEEMVVLGDVYYHGARNALPRMQSQRIALKKVTPLKRRGPRPSFEPGYDATMVVYCACA